jgi:methylaspartate mutase epsilon subunit
MAGQLAWNAAVSALSGSCGMFIKSPDEATTTPTGKGFREAMEICGQVVRLMADQRLPESEDLRIERSMIEMEVCALVDKIMEMGDGDIAVGVCHAFEAGFLDTMFSPYRYLKGKVKVVRDANGALRYLDHGNLPLPAEVVEYHRAAIAKREAREGTKADVRWIVREATWASRSMVDEVSERKY